MNHNNSQAFFTSYHDAINFASLLLAEGRSIVACKEQWNQWTLEWE